MDHNTSPSPGTSGQSDAAPKLEVIRPALPKGGGAIAGMGETFQADEFTGTASLNIPFKVTPCRESEPEIGLVYSSGSGNGIAGLGFQLGLPSISRQTSKGIPTYTDSDTFLFSGADYLVADESQPPREEPLQGGVTYLVKKYRPRVEGNFARIEHWTTVNDGSFWKVHAPDNSLSIFGKNTAARISDPERPSLIFEWLLEETLDAHGNATRYTYKQENTENIPDTVSELNRQHTANRYPERICYGNTLPLQAPACLAPATDAIEWHFEVVFDYGERDLTSSNPYVPVRAWEIRPDPFSSYHAGFEQRTMRLCKHILLFHRFPAELGPDPLLVHALRLDYHLSSVASQLQQVQHTGYLKHNEKYTSKSLPPLVFEYTPFHPQGHTFQAFAEEGGGSLPGVSDGGHYSLTDLYGEGIPGILYANGQSLYYREAKSNDTDQPALYGPWKEVLSFPVDRQVNSPSHSLIDFTGNGRLDLLVSTEVYTGYYEANALQQWTGFYPLTSLPVTYRDSLNQHADITGDGLADLVRIEKEYVVVYPALRAKGFGEAILEPRPQTLPLSRLSSPNEFLGFDDLLGAGQPQLVRITEGSVECWPSLGYGRFGNAVRLQNAPFFSGNFDSSRLRLADLDGSGPADLIYIHADHVQVFFNQSGNGFSDPMRIDLPEAWDNLSQVHLADVLGNGTHCLVFTKANPEPKHWFYDFCQARKPYLLCETDNQMGARHRLEYCASTRFYLADKQAGKPWATRLPFPVQVVASTESIDAISNTRLTSTYHYRHGYYDETEREFRGFGCVERCDTETYEAMLAWQQKNPGLDAPGQKFFVPPALSKTWYHPGTWLDGRDIREHFRAGFYDRDTEAKVFPHDDIALGEYNDVATRQEAYRALKGQVLRSELYGLDGTAWEQHPYTVSENQHHVRLLQPRGNNRYAVFLVHQRESIAYQYERNPADPMVSQEFALELNEYGHVLRACHVTYPRRGEGLPQQKKLHAIAQQTRLEHCTDPMAGYLLAVAIEAKSLELHGLNPDTRGYFSFASLRAQVEGALNNATLLSWERNYYYNPPTAQLLPLGEFTPQALPGRTETVELEVQHTRNLFQGVLEEAALENLLTGTTPDKGGFTRYTQGPESNYYWNPGPLQQYAGAALFYLPVRFADPFGNVTEYTYDAYRMNVVQVCDPLGNETHIEAIDYRLMTPLRIRDANGQVAEVRNDALGMVTVTALHGYEGGTRKGFPDLSTYAPLDEPASAEQVLALPAAYLQGAATFFYYDAWAWKRRQEPVHALSLAAEKYPGEPEAAEHITITLKYNDGFGRDLQQKLRVREAGEARALRADGTIEIIAADPRWLNSGAVRYNNKGKAIQQYEPFYADTWRYLAHRDYSTVGVSSLLFYDPLERVVRTEVPKAKDNQGKLLTLFTKVQWGDGLPSPWAERHFDANDTIKDSVYYRRIFDEQGNVRPDSPVTDKHELNTLRKAVVFYNTPDTNDVDNLGRVIRVVQQLKDSHTTEPEMLITSHELDILGNVLTSADPRLGAQGKHNLVIEYARNKKPIRTISVDAGTHWQLTNTAGNPLFSCDARHIRVRHHYDALQRPLRVWMQPAATAPEQCVQVLLYGDSRYTDGAGNSKPYFINPEKWNTRGMPVVHLDEAGCKVSAHYSIAGKPLATGVQVVKNYKEEVNWAVATTDLWKALANEIERRAPEQLPELKLPTALAALLEAQRFTAYTTYDALARVTEAKDPDGNISRPHYYSTGWLKKVTMEGRYFNDAPALDHITYDAKGQRMGIRYGNGVQSKYTYNECTYELKQLRTTRNQGNDVLQDISYWYDGAGNVGHITDHSCPTVFCNGQQVEPDADYTYDSVYRLVKATGREHAGLWEQHQQGPPSLAQGVNDANKLQNYTQLFTYDTGGNLLQEKHLAAQSSACRTRTMTADAGSNRVTSSALGNCDGEDAATEHYQFDVNGNQLNLGSRLSKLAWNYRSNIQKVILVERNAEAPDAEYYVYDSGGRRVRKVTERYANQGSTLTIDETLYIGGFEVHLKKQQAGQNQPEVKSEWHTVRFEPAAAEWRYWIKGDITDSAEKSHIRYQLENHLNSAVMELDQQAQVITWEEYYPYGGTAVMAGSSDVEVKAKRYRYSGKEKDANTGLYYYGMRYYCPWLCRWLSADPAGTVDGLNLYAFVGGNPIKHVDVGGMMKLKGVIKKMLDFTIKETKICNKNSNFSKKKKEFSNFESDKKEFESNNFQSDKKESESNNFESDKKESESNSKWFSKIVFFAIVFSAILESNQVLEANESRIHHKPTSGAVIPDDARPGTFLIGSFSPDLKFILSELNYPTTSEVDFDFKVPEGQKFNLLNISDEAFFYWRDNGGFFTMVNGPWIDAAVSQKQDIIVVSKLEFLYNSGELSGFGKEVHRLEWEHGYRYDPKTKMMVPPDKAGDLPTLTLQIEYKHKNVNKNIKM